MKIRIGDQRFSSKAAAARAIRALLYRYAPGTTVGGPDAAFLADLLACHPEAAGKVGSGVISFQIEQNFGSRGFWLTRRDGSRTDWSFLSCLTPPTQTQEVKAAFRTEVRDQIQTFKRQQFRARPLVGCPITGESLTLDTAHVDHVPPFEDLLAAFLARATLTLDAVRVTTTTDGETDTWLVDRSLAQHWATYHGEAAGLRLVSRFANLSVLRRRGRCGENGGW